MAVFLLTSVAEHGILILLGDVRLWGRELRNKYMDILTDQQLQIRTAEREALRRLSNAIGALEADKADLEALRQADEDLEEFFCWWWWASSTRGNRLS